MRWPYGLRLRARGGDRRLAAAVRARAATDRASALSRGVVVFADLHAREEVWARIAGLVERAPLAGGTRMSVKALIAARQPAAADLRTVLAALEDACR
jgi:hypothetical protein